MRDHQQKRDKLNKIRGNLHHERRRDRVTERLRGKLFRFFDNAPMEVFDLITDWLYAEDVANLARTCRYILSTLMNLYASKPKPPRHLVEFTIAPFMYFPSGSLFGRHVEYNISRSGDFFVHTALATPGEYNHENTVVLKWPAVTGPSSTA